MIVASGVVAAPSRRRPPTAGVGWAVGVALAAGSTGWMPVAQAGTITILDTSYVASSQGLLTRDCFTVATGGATSVQLTDLDWYQALASLSFKLTNAAGVAVGSLSGPGTSTFELSGPGKYFVTMYAVGAVNAVPALSFGSYGVDITFTGANASSVPVPGASVLLASGLALAQAFRQWRLRRSRARVGGSVCA